MRAGQVVRFVGAGGGHFPATVSAVVGSGASTYKRLSLDVEGKGHLPDVPHANDREDGLGFWVLNGEVVPVTARNGSIPRRMVSTGRALFHRREGDG